MFSYLVAAGGCCCNWTPLSRLIEATTTTTTNATEVCLWHFSDIHCGVACQFPLDLMPQPMSGSGSHCPWPGKGRLSEAARPQIRPATFGGQFDQLAELRNLSAPTGLVLCNFSRQPTGDIKMGVAARA